MRQQAAHVGGQLRHPGPLGQHGSQRIAVQRIDLGAPGIACRLGQQAALVGAQLFIEQAATVEGMLAQHALAPGVDGVNRRFVHGLGRRGQAPGGLGTLGTCRVGDQQALQQAVLRRRLLHTPEAAGRLQKPRADAVAQLAGGGAGEGHHQDLRRPQRAAKAAVGPAMAQHQAQVERGNGPGLAGAGAGLDQPAAPQRQAQGVQGLTHPRLQRHPQPHGAARWHGCRPRPAAARTKLRPGQRTGRRH